MPDASDMTDDELLAAYARALKSLKRANKKVDDLRTQLAKNCSHPAKYIRTYKWEHDNGYGRQSTHEGFTCDICREDDPYKTGRFYKPSYQRDEY